MTFADEIKPGDQSTWAYITVISIPNESAREALSRLERDRKEAKFGDELKWTNLRALRGPNTRLARKWIGRLVDEHDLWRFSIVGFDLKMLNMTSFGHGAGPQFTNAYRRFYRSNLKNHVSGLHLGANSVVVRRSYHDRCGRLEADPWFDFHPNLIVGSAETVEFVEKRIRFVDSCHHKEQAHPSASHFIQLADILGGATRYIFEAVGRNEARDNVVGPLLPLIERINDTNRASNINSSYKHVGRASVSFFPSRALSAEEMDDQFARSLSCFFRNRPLRLLDELSGQLALFDQDGTQATA